MITNDFEYRVTREIVEGFKKALALLNSPDNEKKKAEPFVWQLNVDAVQSSLEEFSEQLQEYETLTNWDSNKPIAFESDEINDSIGRVLIKVRLACKFGQKELAEELGISEKLLQQYEERDYQEAPLFRVIEVMEILGIKLQQKVVVSHVSRRYLVGKSTRTIQV